MQMKGKKIDIPLIYSSTLLSLYNEVELKVEYGAGKFVKFMKKINMKVYKRNCPTLAHLTPNTICIRYADEDGD